jgi:DNA-binding response OmpR family regulator
MRIMVIEDEAVTRTLFKKFMEPHGFTVIEAVDGIDAFKKMDDKIEVIFLDWLMPNMSGLEFLEEFRANKNMSHVKVIMVTALSEIDNVVDAMEEGADDYIIKPFNSDVLIEKIKKVLPNRRID